MPKRNNNNNLNDKLDNWNSNLEKFNKTLDKTVQVFGAVNDIAKSVADIESSMTKSIEQQTEAYKKQTADREKADRKRREKEKKELAKQFKDYEKQYGTVRSVSDWFDLRDKKSLRSQYKNIVTQVDKEMAGYKSGTAYKDKQGNLTATGEARRQEKIVELMGEAIDNFDDSVNKFGKSTQSFRSQLFSWVGQTAMSLLNTAYNTTKQGIQNQANVYENTFSNVATRSGLNKDLYRNAQQSLGGWGTNKLGEMGVFRNVAASEVQTMWDTMASNGFSLVNENGQIDEAKVFADSIDAIITNKIVPYLDTSTQDFQLINQRLDGKFVKDIRGINQLNQELVGNNFATSEILNQLIDMVQPMSDEAIRNLASSSAELTAYANYLMSEEGGSLSYDQAMSTIATLKKEQSYGSTMLTSGSPYERMQMINLLEKGINPHNSAQFGEAIKSNLGVQQLWASTTPRI